MDNYRITDASGETRTVRPLVLQQIGLKIGASALGVYIVMEMFRDEDDVFRWSVPLLAGEVGLSDRQTQRILHKLCRYGVIERIDYHTKNNAVYRTEYRLVYAGVYDKLAYETLRNDFFRPGDHGEEA